MPARIVNISSSGGPINGRIVIGQARFGEAEARLWDAKGRATGKKPDTLAHFFSDEQEAIEDFDIGSADNLNGDILTASVEVAAWTTGQEQYYTSLSVYQDEKVLAGGHLVSSGPFTVGIKVDFQLRFNVIA